MLVRIKPLEWFEENAFSDEDGDFWPNEKDRDLFNQCEVMEIPDEVREYNTHHLNSLVIKNKILHIDSKNLDDIMWGVEKVLDPEKDSMYYV